MTEKELELIVDGVLDKCLPSPVTLADEITKYIRSYLKEQFSFLEGSDGTSYRQACKEIAQKVAEKWEAPDAF